MNKHAFLALGLLLFGGCLLPRYELDPPGAVGAAGSSSVAGTTGTTTGGAAGSTGTPIGDAGMSGTDNADDCGASSKLCDGMCVALDDVEYGCTATSCNKSACPAPGTGTLTCEAGECAIGSCGADMKKCTGQCVSNDDPNYGCGATTCDASGCEAAGTGTLICRAGACVVGACGTNTKKCGNKCVPLDRNNGCGDPAACAPCAASETCEGPGVTKCECVPDNLEACSGKQCGPAINNCGQPVNCPDKCSSPNTCGGGTAGVNECGCTPDDPCALQSCGSATNRCGKPVQCSNRCPGGLPVCVNDACHQCQAASDCPAPTGNPCAKASCTNLTCGFTTVAANTNCAGGGKCSATAAGVCVRPPVDAGEFKIDATEVTRGAYAVFVAAKNGNTSGQPAVCGFNTSYAPAEASPTIDDYDKPVRTDWCDARAYCASAGGRICGKRGGGSLTFDDFDDPALSQWMRACGGTNGTVYPYGNSYAAGACNTQVAGAEAPVAKVATFPACVGGFAGLYDMSGNEQEWDDSCNGTTGANDYCRQRGGSTYPSFPPDQTLPHQCGWLTSNERSGLGAIRCCYDE